MRILSIETGKCTAPVRSKRAKPERNAPNT